MRYRRPVTVTDASPDTTTARLGSLVRDARRHRGLTQQQLADQVFSSADALEGARAFAEKRAPVWRGA